jgi:hypothetical protein
MRQRWRFGILRFMLQGEVVWVGRIVDITYDYPGTNADGFDLCPCRLEASGLYTVLTDKPADLSSSYVDEGASSSAGQLVKDIVTEQGWPIRPTFYGVEQTGINLGQLRVGDQDTSLDVLINALTAGGTDGVTYVFLQEEPENGPKLIAYGVGVARWQLPIRGIGLSCGWNGEEQAYRVRAVFTDGTGSSANTEFLDNPDYVDLNNGVRRERVISLSGMDEQAAINGVLSYLVQHGNPLALAGSPTIAPHMGEVYGVIQGPEGGLRPAWRVRAGHLIRMLGFRRGDPEANEDAARTFAVETTSYDVETGSLTFSLDQRAVRPSLNEDPAALLRLRNSLEPGFAHTGRKHYVTEQGAATLVSGAGDIPIDTASGEIVIPSAASATIVVTAEISDGGTSTATAHFYLGLTIDDETWDKNDRTMAQRMVFPNGLNTGVETRQVRITRAIPSGIHQFQAYAFCANGSYSITHAEIDFDY